MDIELIEATEADLPVVGNLSSYYVYDFTEYMGWPCPESGLFGGCDEMFDDWRAGRNHPFVIRADGKRKCLQTTHQSSVSGAQSFRNTHMAALLTTVALVRHGG